MHKTGDMKIWVLPMNVGRETIPLASAMLFFCAHARALDRESVVQNIIIESLASYPEKCPCPYNKDCIGHSCARRSAYSRPGGEAPICFAGDVTDEMVQKWISKH